MTGSQRGQGMITLLLVLSGISVVLVAIWLSRLDEQRKQTRAAIREVAFHQVALQLKVLFRDPAYLRALFYKLNPELDAEWRHFLATPAGPAQATPERTTPKAKPVDIRIYTADAKPWIGGGMGLSYPGFKLCGMGSGCPIRGAVTSLTFVTEGAGPRVRRRLEMAVQFGTSAPAITGFLNPEKRQVDVVLEEDDELPLYDAGRAECPPDSILVSLQYPDVRVWCRKVAAP
jgi:hypothetical protein